MRAETAASLDAPRFYSSRDPERRLVSFETALLAGLAPDGGLYLPEFVPRLGPETWLGAASPAELGERVFGAWLGGALGPAALRELLADALDFPLPLVEIGDGVQVLELFHGPTLSFKDVGARVMARLMERALARRGERRVILVATSGDTGSAVADGFAGMSRLSVVLLYPRGLVSPVQERQLIVRRPRVRALAVEGDFDDCQRLVKAAFADPALEQVPLSSANSINVGRLLPQTLYYLWAARELNRTSGDAATPPNLCVPSGNLGNLTAAVLASGMGLGVHRFIAAHNANRFFPEFLAERAQPFAFARTVPTRSNAMDVGAPSNFERLHALLGEAELRERVWGSSVDDASTLERIRRTSGEAGYLACPHTAVGLEALERYRAATDDRRAALVVATAHPAKFPEAIAAALGHPGPSEAALEALWQRETSCRSIPPQLSALREVLLEPSDDASS